MPSNDSDPLRTADHILDSSADPRKLPNQAAAIETTSSDMGEEKTGSYGAGNGVNEALDSTGREILKPAIPGYEILSVLGRGGMGVVYKARHLALKRIVALKMVLAGGHAGPRDLARFRIEAEAAARLHHPNIVQIHEVGAADGHPYCTLEFVEGGNLASTIANKPLNPRQAAELVETLARAMQLAHSRNVVHRDLKPANILLAADGTPKITDFGLARQLDNDSGETQAGAVMGTPSYMAPEQASGNAHTVGPTADVYALGAILFDCLAGRPPFKGKTVVETLDLVRTEEPTPPSRWQTGVPLDLDTICLKCLRKEPRNRYASAAALADDLRRFLRGKAILARPVGMLERSWKWVKRNPTMTAAAVVLLAASVVSLLFWADARHKKKEVAEAQGDLAAKTTELDQTREQEEAAHAQKWLTPLAEVPNPVLNDAEIATFAALASSDERLQRRFLTEAIKPSSRRKLAARSDFAMQALVGLDLRKRQETERILIAELVKLEPSDETRTELALSLAGLGGLSHSSAAEVAAILLRALSRTSVPNEIRHVAQSLATVTSDLEAHEAARLSAQANSLLTKALTQARERALGNALAQGLMALAAHLEPAEAAKGLSDLTQMMKGASFDQIVSDEQLAQCLSALAVRLDPKEVAKTASTLAQEMIRTGDFFRQQRLAQALPALTPHMNPGEAAALLTQVITNIRDNNSVRRLGKGLSLIAGRLADKDAEAAAAAISSAVLKATDSFHRDSLVLALQCVVGHLNPKTAAVAAAALLQALAKEGINIFDVASLGMALWTIAGRLEPDEAATCVKKITLVMAKSVGPIPSEALVLTLLAASAKLESKEAAKLLPALIDAFAKLSNPSAHEELIREWSALLVRFEPGELEHTAADIVARIKQARMTQDYNTIMCLARCVPAVAKSLKPGDAAAVADAMVQVLTVIKEGHNALQPLTEGLAAAASRLEPKESARLTAMAVESLTRAIDLANGNSPASLPYYARSLSAIATRLEAREAARVSAQGAAKLADAIGRNNDRDARSLQFRLQGLSALASHFAPTDATSVAAALMHAMTKEYGETQDQGFGLSLQPERTTTLTRALAETLGSGKPQLADQDLVDLLKQPLCAGLVRRAMLNQLQVRYQRPFANQWDFVRFAEDHQLGLNFTKSTDN